MQSVQLLEQLLNRHDKLTDDQWSQLCSLDPGIARVDKWLQRCRYYGSALCLLMLAVVMMAISIALLFLILTLAVMLQPSLNNQLEASIDYLGGRVLGLPMGDRCLISLASLMPDSVSLDVLRQPVWDCGFCKNLTSVPRVSKVDPSEFYRNFIEHQIPVVVTDATGNWSVGQFSYNYFKRLYNQEADWEQQDRCQFFPYRTEFRGLGEFFEMPEARANLEAGEKPWYVGWSNCDVKVAGVLRNLYSRPYFLPREAETLGTDWIFIGSPQYGANMHVDNVGNPSWQAQVKGRKRWNLWPPLECSYQCQRLSVVVEPGEVIALDTTVWYHGTQIMPGDMSIAIGAEFD